ncbi:MAG: hypothetical protein HRT47_13870 [Candidatus Caenarcaniphilales bacterium]|nr:hypothetical protein [Candidatus Caenarcaniphilales bacterium]
MLAQAYTEDSIKEINIQEDTDLAPRLEQVLNANGNKEALLTQLKKDFELKDIVLGASFLYIDKFKEGKDGENIINTFLNEKNLNELIGSSVSGTISIDDKIQLQLAIEILDIDHEDIAKKFNEFLY